MQMIVVSAGVDARPVEFLKASVVSMHDAFQSSDYGLLIPSKPEEHCDLSLRQADCRCTTNQNVSVLISVNFPSHRMNRKFT